MDSSRISSKKAYIYIRYIFSEIISKNVFSVESIYTQEIKIIHYMIRYVFNAASKKLESGMPLIHLPIGICSSFGSMEENHYDIFDGKCTMMM